MAKALRGGHPDVLSGPRDALVDGDETTPCTAIDLAPLLQERKRATHGSWPRDRHEAAARIAELSIPLERAPTKAPFLADVTRILDRRRPADSVDR